MSAPVTLKVLRWDAFAWPSGRLAVWLSVTAAGVWFASEDRLFGTLMVAREVPRRFDSPAAAAEAIYAKLP